jgi:hypothetical protein
MRPKHRDVHVILRSSFWMHLETNVHFTSPNPEALTLMLSATEQLYIPSKLSADQTPRALLITNYISLLG